MQALALGADTISLKLLDALVAKIDDPFYVQAFFRERASAMRSDGRSEVPIVMGDLMGLAETIPSERIEPFVTSMFEIMDDLDLDRDNDTGFYNSGTNQLRMHWLINELVRDRFEQAERGALFKNALGNASLGWMIDMTRRIRSEHQPGAHERPTLESQRLVDPATAAELTNAVVTKIRAAAQSGELLKAKHLLSNLYRWKDFLNGGEEVRRWTDARLSDDRFVLQLGDAVTATTWSSSIGFDGMGDRVSRGLAYVQIDGLESILDVERFLARVTEIEGTLSDEKDRQIMARFREGLKRRDEEQARRNRSSGLTTPLSPAEREEENEVFAAATSPDFGEADDGTSG